MQSSNESDGSEEYFDAEDSTPHRLVKYVYCYVHNINNFVLIYSVVCTDKIPSLTADVAAH